MRGRALAPSNKFVRMVSSSISLGVWKVRTTPNRARWLALRAVKVRSSSATAPLVGLTKPEMTLRNVVLPAPLGPTKPMRSGPSKDKDNWRSTFSSPKLTEISWALSAIDDIALTPSLPFRPLGPTLGNRSSNASRKGKEHHNQYQT